MKYFYLGVRKISSLTEFAYIPRTLAPHENDIPVTRSLLDLWNKINQYCKSIIIRMDNSIN